MTTRGASAAQRAAGADRTARANAVGAARHLALVVTGGALLVGFAVIVVRETLATLGVVDPVVDDSYELFAVSLTGLAGGAFAAGVRSDQRRRTREPTRPANADDRWRGVLVVAFVSGYVVAGTVALLVCLIRLGASTTTLRGLAAAFLGTSVATLTAFLDLPGELAGEVTGGPDGG